MINNINDMLRYFNREEFACQYTGKNKIDDQFLIKLDHLRYVCGFPFIITSGYRDPSHPIEAKKKLQELTHKVSPVTSGLRMVSKGMTSLNTPLRWGSTVSELLTALSMLTSASWTLASLL